MPLPSSTRVSYGSCLPLGCGTGLASLPRRGCSCLADAAQHCKRSPRCAVLHHTCALCSEHRALTDDAHTRTRAFAADAAVQCEQQPPSGGGFSASEEAARLQSVGKSTDVATVTPYGGLSAAILPTGETLCTEAADHALAAHTNHERLHEHAYSGARHDESARLGASHGGTGHGGVASRGLWMVHAYRQSASEFAASAHLLGMSTPAFHTLRQQ